MRHHTFRASGPARRAGGLAPALILTLVVTAFGLMPQATRPVLAQPAVTPAVEQLPGPAGHVTRLFTPASGALHAQGTGPLSRSDDDGRVWSVLFDATGGAATGSSDTRVTVTIGGVAVDPARPNRLFAAFRERAKSGSPTVTVRVTEDGGAAWTDLGTLPVEQVYDLGLGIDGANLYAATDQGVWRVHLA